MTVTNVPVPAFSAAELPGLCDKLGALDLDLRRIVDEYGYPEFWNRPNTFESLVWFVLEQQVSLASARAALEKLRDRVGAITPANVLALTDEELRAAYLPRAAPVADVVAAARRWAPYRTIGTMLVWHHYLSRRIPRRH